MPISLEDAYDTLSDEGRFTALIDAFAERLGARTYAGGWASSKSVEQLVAFKGFDDAQVHTYLSKYAPLDPWTLAFLKSPVYGRFLNMLDYVDPATYARSALYSEFFVPEGLDVFYAVSFTMLTDGTQSGLTFHRGKKDGEFDHDTIAAVNMDAKDLARLFHLKVRMAQLLDKNGDWQDLLSRIDVELYLIDPTGRLVDCNDLGKVALDEERGLTIRTGRIQATDAADKASLQRILLAARENQLEATDGFVIGAGETRRRLTVLPLTGANGAMRLALVGESTKDLNANLENALRALFGLSPTEAAIMLRLANGEGPKEISHSRAVSQETTRTQYRSAMMKMECRTLTEAIIAIRRLPSVRV